MQQSNPNDEAMMWLIRLNSGEMTPDQRQAFETWLQNPKHRAAFIDAEQIWNDADHLEIDPNSGRVQVQPEALPTTATIRFPRYIALASAACCGLFILLLSGLPEYWLADQVTGIKPQLLTLADGSQLHLDADSALNIDLTENQRLITLIKGACWFTVAADPDRPFRVVTENLSVTALGTEFLVDWHTPTPYVAVTEHAVRVEDKSHSVHIGQGRSLYADANTSVWQSEISDRQHTEGFRGGRLIAENQPLREVINALSRYRHGLILISDDKLAEERVNAVFDIRRPDSALDALRQILPIKIIRFSAFLTVIVPA